MQVTFKVTLKTISDIGKLHDSLSLFLAFPCPSQRQMAIEREKIEYRFEKLQKFLQEQERLLFAWLEKLAKEVVTRKDENVLRLSEEVSRLNTLISEMEEKCEQPTSEFLQVRLCERYPRPRHQEWREAVIARPQESMIKAEPCICPAQWEILWFFEGRKIFLCSGLSGRKFP